MTEKIIIFSDFHIHHHQGDWRRVEDAIDVLKWIHDEAIDRKISKVYFLGDFFHIRGYMYPSIVAKVYAELLRFRDSGIELSMLIGNHDMPYKTTTKHNCVTAFGSICNIVEDVSLSVVGDWNFLWLPYIESVEKLNWAIDKIPVDGKKNCLLAHLDIVGAHFHGQTKSTEGITTKFSKKFDMVITGHYHKKQEPSENIFYVGSPYQQNFAEAGDEKGFYIFDNGNLEFVKNTFSPEYMYLTSDKVDENISGNYVTITVEDSNSLAQVRENAAQYSPRQVTVRVDRTAIEEDRQLVSMHTDAKDVGALLKEWVKKTANPKIYDTSELFSYGMDIVKES